MLKHILVLKLLFICCSESVEFCAWEYFQPRCSNNEIIVVDRATFGRKTVGRCLTEEGVSDESNLEDPKFFGCYADVKGYMEEQCAGRTQCEVPVMKIKVDTRCHKWLKFHLEIEYSCLSVMQDTRHCSVNLAHGKQFISSKAFNKGSCGSKHQPWMIESMTGQQIRINVAYIVESDQAQLRSVQFLKQHFDRKQENTCSSLGQIKENQSKYSTIICLSEDGFRSSNEGTFTTELNSIEVILEDNKNVSTGFVLAFEATGCSDLIPPADAWLKRTENEATIGCYSTRLRWQLKCVGQRWIGVIGNCSHGHHMNELNTIAVEPVRNLQDQTIPIVTIAVAGFVVCFFIICIGTVFLNRYYALSKARMMKQTIGTYKMGFNGSIYNDDSNGKYALDTIKQNIKLNETTDNFSDPVKYYELDQTLICKE